jgi:hypothetical protein
MEVMKGIVGDKKKGKSCVEVGHQEQFNKGKWARPLTLLHFWAPCIVMMRWEQN